MSVDIPTPVFALSPKSRSGARRLVACRIRERPSPGSTAATRSSIRVPAPDCNRARGGHGHAHAYAPHRHAVHGPIDGRRPPPAAGILRARTFPADAARPIIVSRSADPVAPCSRKPARRSRGAGKTAGRRPPTVRCCSSDFAAPQQRRPRRCGVWQASEGRSVWVKQGWGTRKCRYTSTKAADFMSKLRSAFCAAAPDVTAGQRRIHAAHGTMSSSR